MSLPWANSSHRSSLKSGQHSAHLGGCVDGDGGGLPDPCRVCGGEASIAMRPLSPSPAPGVAVLAECRLTVRCSRSIARSIASVALLH